MEKVLAIVVLLVFVWLAIPHLAQGQWIAPTAIAPNSWVVGYDTTGNAAALATPPQGYGWFHFDFWNTPTTAGQPVTRSDFSLRR
jgi:hypothetical protein